MPRSQQFKRSTSHSNRRSPQLSGLLARIGLMLVLSFGAIASRAQQVPGTNQWEILENCQLVTNAVVDGDSFHILHDGREYIFRLYFVDAPEKESSLKERIQDQAAYFGIAEDDVTRAGGLAARFTRQKLTETNFTVTTRWQNAMGRSSLARFYCVLTVNDENLAELLVANGIARIYGLRANVPGGLRSTTFINKLKNLELTAREKKLGVWDESQFPRMETGEAPASTTNAVGETTSPIEASTALVDVNTATHEELMALPGIGKVMAERIVTNRPFATVDDLRRVPGIGAKTLDKLRPLVHVAPAEADVPAAD